MKYKVLYWDEIVAHADILATYKKQFDQLLSGDYKAAGLDLKKSQGHRVWSVRVNGADRLLFTVKKDMDTAGRAYLVFLEVVREHDYAKARYMQPQVLKKFMENKAQSTLETARFAQGFFLMMVPAS